jgi:hypothetical protein
MTIEHSFGDLPEIDQHKFSSIIQAYKNALVPRTEGDSSILDSHKMGVAEEIGELDPDMTFPEVLNMNRREYGKPNRKLFATRTPSERDIREHTSQPASAFLDTDFRNHLHSENIPHGASSVGWEDEYHLPTIFNVEGVPTAVSWDAPAHNDSLDFPHIKPFDEYVHPVTTQANGDIINLAQKPEGKYERLGTDDDWTPAEAQSEREYIQDFSALNQDKDGLLEFDEVMLDPRYRAGGYTVPARLLGRGDRSKGRTSHFNTGKGMSEITGEDDIELNPKKGYSKWG